MSSKKRVLNFGKRFGAINSWEPGEINLRERIIRKKFENIFYDPLGFENCVSLDVIDTLSYASYGMHILLKIMVTNIKNVNQFVYIGKTH